MLKRTEREDTEGYFRWHWVLTEFLAIYCEITDQRCFGVKKALKLLEKKDAQGYDLYRKALQEFNRESAGRWITYLKQL